MDFRGIDYSSTDKPQSRRGPRGTG